MEATHQHLTTIAEFMGWELVEMNNYFYTRSGHGIISVNSFDTMRMVFDRLQNEIKLDVIDPVNMHEATMLVCHFSLCLLKGTPSDCAARLHEAIEWWKTVKS